MGYKLTWVYIRPNGTEQKIRPEWWTPWADTIVYYPFSSDYNDHSWNGYNITTTGASSIWINQWVSCLSVNNSKVSASTIDAMTTYNEYTWLFYCYRVSDWLTIQFNEWGAWGWNWPSFRSWNTNEVRWGNDTNTYTQFSSSYCPMNTRFLWALVVRNGDWIIYCNNNSTTIKTWVIAPVNNASGFNIWAVQNDSYAYVSKLIIEKKARTDQEILDYFDATKANYWIS